MIRPSVLRFGLAAALLSLVTTPLAAQADGGAKPGFGLVLEGGVEMGGEKVIELTFTNGDTQNLSAGQGGTIAAGLQYRFPAQPKLSLSGTIGYKFVTNASENADIGISRLPLEVVARWTLNPSWWIGAGVVKHNAIEVEGDGFFPDATLDGSVGPTIELGWKALALTYTAMTYTAPNDETFNAGAFGLSARWVWQSKAK